MLSQDHREALLQSFARGHEDVMETLRQIPNEVWEYRPGPHSWNIHQVLVHLADSEAKGYVRCRSIIAESGGRVMAYDQDRWAQYLNYEDQPIELVLELFRILRELNWRLISRLPDDVWQRYTHHSERGKITLDDWLVMYEQHVHLHIAQMKRNLQHWQKHAAQTPQHS